MGYICGIDEAGRGPVIGPLVMCGVCAEPSDDAFFESIGVDDSKKLTPEKREELYPLIVKRFKYFIVALTPKQIDDAMESGVNLNTQEAKASADIIQMLSPSAVILDCPSTNPKAYTEQMRKLIANDSIPITSEHKADEKYLVVGAASIIAKVTRDRIIEEQKKKVGIDFGSGYPSDPKTIAFIAKHHTTHKELFRRSWKTYQAAIQKKLGEY